MPHVFASYVRENADVAERLVKALRAHGIEVWYDRSNLVVGDRWPQAITTAIRNGSSFIACFSPTYALRDRTYMNEELTTAIEELRLRPRDRRWFLPVKLEPCEIPALELGQGETLESLHHVDLSRDWDTGLGQLVHAIRQEQLRHGKQGRVVSDAAGAEPQTPQPPLATRPDSPRRAESTAADRVPPSTEPLPAEEAETAQRPSRRRPSPMLITVGAVVLAGASSASFILGQAASGDSLRPRAGSTAAPSMTSPDASSLPSSAVPSRVDQPFPLPTSPTAGTPGTAQPSPSRERSAGSSQPSARGTVNCDAKSVVLQVGVGIELASCGVGGNFTDVTFNGSGLVVDDSIATRSASKGGTSATQGGCEGKFLYTGNPHAPSPITEAACLQSGQDIAYVDVRDLNSTRAIVDVFFWAER